MKTKLFLCLCTALCPSSCATDSVRAAEAGPIRSGRINPDTVGSHSFQRLHSATWDKHGGTPAFSNAADYEANR